MSTPRRRIRRQLAVVVIVPLSLLAGVAGAPAAHAGAATYVDATGDVIADGTGAPMESSAGDIVAYNVDLGDSSLWVGVLTGGTEADPLPELGTFVGSGNYANIGIDTGGDFQHDFYATTTDEGGWVVYDESTGLISCSVGQLTSGPDVFAFEVPLWCIGSPSHVGIQVLLFVNNGSDFAPDSYVPGTPGASSGPDVTPADVPRVAVYRFWSPVYGNAHFFTTSSMEADGLYHDGYYAWRFEGFAFSALPTDGATCDDGMPIYRFWSPVFRSHFYTLNAGEKDHIVATDRNWQYEGVAYCAYAIQEDGTVPLYRFWSPNFRKHFFTADQAEADHIRAVDHNWLYEGVAAYVFQEA